MTFELTGKIVQLNDTQQVSERFKKREFVLEVNEVVNDKTYTDYAKMQFTQAKCDILDNFQVGQQVKVNFNIKGNKWERDGKVNYMTNLDAWRIEKVDAPVGITREQQQFVSPKVTPADYDPESDLPF